MKTTESTFDERLEQRGVSRRDFLKFCGVMAATLSLPRSGVSRIAEALALAPRPPVVWLEFQDCTGDTESLLRSGSPTIDDLLLNQISLDYHETLMVPAGAQTELSLSDTIRDHAGEYLLIVEGSIPTAAGGGYCTIRGRTALSILEEAAADARAVIAVGTCAYDGGLAAAAPNPTGAVGVKGALPGLDNLVNLPGCPANAHNIAATLVYVLTYSELPATDGERRPKFAYDEEIHEDCERHEFYEHDQYVLAWGDEGHRKGWCLKKMGCKGPETHHNCNSVKWNEGVSWPIGAGHGCVGCSEPNFWDRMTPFYSEDSDDDDHDDDHDDDDHDYDYDGDGDVDVADIQLLAGRWREAAGPPYDVDGDGLVTVVDIMRAAAHWGESLP